MDANHKYEVVPIQSVYARAYRVVRPIGDQPHSIDGWLLGVSDGERTGWWGPVTRQVAELAVGIFSHVKVRSATTPAVWAERAKLATRHAHAGIGAVAIGTLELASWDLLGLRANCPVWQLWSDRPAVDSVLCYATCFEFFPTGAIVPEVATELAQAGWIIQKWRPPRDASAAQVVSDLVAAAEAGGGRLAIDLNGSWPRDEVQRMVSAIRGELAFVEEPVPPWRLAEAKQLALPWPLAAGEHCYGLHEAPLLEQAGVAVWQPDAVFCGGFVSLRAILERAAQVGATGAPHGGGLVPAVHAAVLGTPVSWCEWHLTLEPRRQAHLANPLCPGPDQRLPVPQLPGWAGPLAPDLEWRSS